MTTRRVGQAGGGGPGAGSGGPGAVALGDRELLRQASRTFALSVELLPGPLRRPIEAAYLIARIGDTVADRGVAPAAARIDELERLRGAVTVAAAVGTGSWSERAAAAGAAGPVGEGLLAQGGRDGDERATRAEAQLLAGADRVFDRLPRLPADDRADVERVVDRLLATMVGELRFFEEERPPGAGLAALPTAAALTAYTEGIAGCVGEFWTRLLVRHASLRAVTGRARPALPARAQALLVEGRRYGRGLQMVNVLRDLPRDLRRGRCFLPADELRALGLTPCDLLEPAAGARAAPLLARWQERARRGLFAGFAYAGRLHGAGWRVRAATALPAALGLATLRVLEAAPLEARLDPGKVLRVSRAEVRRILARTAVLAARPRWIARAARPPAG